jgi:cytochrome c oxidase subunit 3
MIAIILGTLFLIGVVGLEWQITPYGPSENAAYSLFYMMTGFHALHVLSGVILLLIVFLKARKGQFDENRNWPVEGAAVYWHFVDVVWIFYYPVLYLIGQPV